MISRDSVPSIFTLKFNVFVKCTKWSTTKKMIFWKIKLQQARVTKHHVVVWVLGLNENKRALITFDFSFSSYPIFNIVLALSTLSLQNLRVALEASSLRQFFVFQTIFHPRSLYSNKSQQEQKMSNDVCFFLKSFIISRRCKSF